LRATYVIPCYNEEKRLDPKQIEALVADPRVAVVLVDDGSKDGTRALLNDIASRAPERIAVCGLDKNGGKAEAVRRGLLTAIGAGADVVGFADADFATPVHELLRLLDELAKSAADIVIGSRVLRLGASIDRKPLRHLVGRVFATVAAAAVGVPVYDTQCGAKLFRVNPQLEAALRTPFSSRWSFDVELLCRLYGRLGEGTAQGLVALEVPLSEWHEVSGSKLHIGSMAKSFAELLGIWARAELQSRRR